MSQKIEKKEISIVIPVYNANKILNELVNEIEIRIKEITNNYEIIFVDDFSQDESWIDIKNICLKHLNTRGIKLYKNSGVDFAITEGLLESAGEFVFIVTCDMTDPLDQIRPMYDKIRNEEVDVICAHYMNKHPESIISKIFSSLYWKIFSFLIGEKYPVEEGLYRVLSRKAVDTYLMNTNKFKHIKITHILGLKKNHISMSQGLRKYGKSSFNLKKKLEFAIDYITTYSYKPLLYSSMIGILLSLLFVFIGTVTIIFKLLGYINVPGWASIIVFSSFLSAIIFINLAIIGIYLSRGIEETKSDISSKVIERA